jgi:hypothetical protein
VLERSTWSPETVARDGCHSCSVIWNLRQVPICLPLLVPVIRKSRHRVDAGESDSGFGMTEELGGVLKSAAEQPPVAVAAGLFNARASNRR